MRIASTAWSEKAAHFAKAPACMMYLTVIPLISMVMPHSKIGQRTSIGKARLQPLTKPKAKPENAMPALKSI
mgnify:CR=1 FL=1